jgi:hypothetical protein
LLSRTCHSISERCRPPGLAPLLSASTGMHAERIDRLGGGVARVADVAPIGRMMTVWIGDVQP